MQLSKQCEMSHLYLKKKKTIGLNNKTIKETMKDNGI
jgi:hypothetical protein